MKIRSRPIQECIRCDDSIVLEKPLLEDVFGQWPEIIEILEKVLSPSELLNLGGPAGGSP